MTTMTAPPTSAQKDRIPSFIIPRMLCILLMPCAFAPAQSIPGCTSAGYRVVAHRWDVALNINWELRQDCSHPDWPARAVAVNPDKRIDASPQNSFNSQDRIPAADQPLLVHAGDPVRLWMQDATVRIETRGIVEHSAHAGEHVIVQITRQTEDAGLTVQRVAGIVRGQNDVEMER